MSKITKLGRLGRMFQGFGYHKTIAREMDKMVQVEVNEVTGGITKIWTGTQAEYDAIATPADDTLYIIVEA